MIVQIGNGLELPGGFHAASLTGIAIDAAGQWGRTNGEEVLVARLDKAGGYRTPLLPGSMHHADDTGVRHQGKRVVQIIA